MEDHAIDELVRLALVEMIDAKHRHDERRAGKLASITPETAKEIGDLTRSWTAYIASLERVDELVEDENAFELFQRKLAALAPTAKDAAAIRSIRLTELREALDADG